MPAKIPVMPVPMQSGMVVWCSWREQKCKITEEIVVVVMERRRGGSLVWERKGRRGWVGEIGFRRLHGSE